MGGGVLWNTFACVNCSVADQGSADKCSKMALFKESLMFFFLFLKRLLWTFIRRAAGGTAPTSCLLTVEHYTAEANLMFSVGGWNYEWTISCTYVKNVQSHESKCTIPKKDQFPFSSVLICYAILSPWLLQSCVLFCDPQYKLVLLLEKYLFLCKYPRGYFVRTPRYCKETAYDF